MQKGFLLVLILAVIVGVFAISNSGVVAVDFIFTEVMVSQAIVIFICVLLGAIIATIFGLIRQMSLKKKTKQLEAENRELQNEIYKMNIEINKKEEDDEITKDL